MVLDNKKNNRFIPQIDPGEFRNRVALLSSSIVSDPGKAQKVNYADFAVRPNVWAKIVYDHGPESVSADALKSTSRLTLTIRFRPDVDATCAIRLQGKIWKFVSPPDNILNRNQYLEVIAELVEGTV